MLCHMNTQHLTASSFVITGADSRTGRALIARRGGAATALVRREDGLEAENVITDWLSSPAARDALAHADVIVHLAGSFGAPTWDDYIAGTVATTELVAACAGPRTRIVYLSQLGADPRAQNWYERAKGLAEEVLRPTDATIFRISAIVGGAENPQPFDLMVRGEGAGAGPVPVPGSGRQRFRPIRLEDVVTAILLASERTTPAGVFDLVGPTERTMQEWVDLAHGAPTSTTRRTDLPPEIDDLLSTPATAGDPAALLAAFPSLALTEWRP